MAPPVAKTVRIPFWMPGAEEGEPRTFITNIFLEVVSFDNRFFWVHVSESPEQVCAAKRGACSVTVPLRLTGVAPAATTQLLEMDASEPASAANSQYGRTTQGTFATSLSQRLTQRIKKDRQVEAVVYVFCAVDGERCVPLLGTECGSGFSSTVEFGGTVFRESLRILTGML